MAEKLLYIIKGLHSYASMSQEEEAKVMASQNITIELIKEIAKTTGCTAFFSDHSDEESAEGYNGALETIASTIEKKDQIFRKIYDVVEREGGGIDAANLFKTFVELWEQGIHIEYKKTEDEVDPVKLLEGKISDEDYAKVKSYVSAGNDPYNLYSEKRLGPILVKTRDENIFKNICDQAEDVNILFIGENHPLEDFNQENHGFKIYTIDVESNGGVTIKGNLPPNYKPFIEDLTYRHQLTNNLNYMS